MGGLDYELLETSSRLIIESKSKDLRILAYLAFVALRNEQWGDLADIFEGLVTLVATHTWEKLHPQRPRAREQSLTWLNEQRFADLLSEKTPHEIDHEAVVRLRTALDTLKGGLEPLYPNGGAFPTALHSAVKKWESQTKPKPKPAAPEGAAAAPEARTPRDIQTDARKAALLLIEAEPDKPMGYRLLRAARWDLVEKEPPNEGGTTQLPAPPQQQRDALAALAGQKEWKKLLGAAQQVFTAGANHLWLDLQRFAAQAAKELGEPFNGVHHAIVVETALVTRRLPGLVQLKFAEGSPMSDAATQDWLTTDVAGVFSSKDAQAHQKDHPGDANADRLGAQRRELNELVAAQRFEEAIALMQEAMAASSNECDNLCRTVLLAEVLVKAKRADMAVSLLDSVDAHIDRYELQRWNPGLCSNAWAAFAAALKVCAAGKNPQQLAALNEKRVLTLGKLSKIDPKRAFTLYT